MLLLPYSPASASVVMVTWHSLGHLSWGGWGPALVPRSSLLPSMEIVSNGEDSSHGHTTGAGTGLNRTASVDWTWGIYWPWFLTSTWEVCDLVRCESCDTLEYLGRCCWIYSNWSHLTINHCALGKQMSQSHPPSIVFAQVAGTRSAPQQNSL